MNKITDILLIRVAISNCPIGARKEELAEMFAAMHPLWFSDNNTSGLFSVEP